MYKEVCNYPYAFKPFSPVNMAPSPTKSYYSVATGSTGGEEEEEEVRDIYLSRDFPAINSDIYECVEQSFDVKLKQDVQLGGGEEKLLATNLVCDKVRQFCVVLLPDQDLPGSCQLVKIKRNAHIHQSFSGRIRLNVKNFHVDNIKLDSGMILAKLICIPWRYHTNKPY